MAGWGDLPRNRLLADVSLWSADLANLEREVERIGGLADSFHFDVADAHFASSLLFFPDLVQALRRVTATPFHVHLMVERPATVLEDFVAAGADLVTVHAEAGADEVREAFGRLRAAGCGCGLALKLETPVEAVGPFADRTDALLLLGTAIGVKGQDLAVNACERIRQARGLVGERVRIIADGGIRSGTVPLLRAAGADAVVPGSLVFGDGRPKAALEWLRSLT